VAVACGELREVWVGAKAPELGWQAVRNRNRINMLVIKRKETKFFCINTPLESI